MQVETGHNTGDHASKEPVTSAIFKHRG